MEFILTHLSRLTVFFVTVVAGVSWWLAPAPQSAPKTQDEADAWTLPAVTPQKPERFVATISGANLWGIVEAATQAPLNEPEWRFAGVTVNGSEKLVMASIENQPLRLLKAGDALPGGAKILKVNEDHLCLSINGKKRKLDLFQ
jgi:hypothetical protein